MRLVSTWYAPCVSSKANLPPPSSHPVIKLRRRCDPCPCPRVGHGGQGLTRVHNSRYLQGCAPRLWPASLLG